MKYPKVIQIHSRDYIGGGGGTIAMRRLHKGLTKEDINSHIVCGFKTSKHSDSTQIPKYKKLRRLENILKLISTKIGLNDIHYLNSFKLLKIEPYLNADIVHFHGTHGYFNYLAMPAVTKNKPAIFTLHDMWPITGHCAFSYDCQKWISGCGACPHLDVHPAVKRDATKIEWKIKKRVFNSSNLHFVAVSRWLEDIAKKSLISELPVHFVPNGLDLSIYQLLEKEYCRSELGIEKHKKVLMFVSLQLNDERKGGGILLKTLNALPASLKKEIVLITLGDGDKGKNAIDGVQTVNLGYVRDSKKKTIAYNAADLFVFPTQADNLPLVLQESLACGTPMVSFNVGGVPEVVRPNITGYVAEHGDVDGFREGILMLLEDEKIT